MGCVEWGVLAGVWVVVVFGALAFAALLWSTRSRTTRYVAPSPPEAANSPQRPVAARLQHATADSPQPLAVKADASPSPPAARRRSRLPRVRLGGAAAATYATAGVAKKSSRSAAAPKKSLYSRVKKSTEATMTAEAIAEMRNYASPPETMHKVMTGVLSLLSRQKGEGCLPPFDEAKLESWNGVRGLLGTLGTEIVKAINSFSPALTSRADWARLDSDLGGKRVADAIRCSAPLATLFTWMSAVETKSLSKPLPSILGRIDV